MPQYFQRLLLFHLRHILKRPKALEAISKLPPCNEDASNVKESLVHMNLSPNQQLVFGSFAARQKSAQPAIDACKAAICHHPHLSFSGCFYATDRSIQCRASTTFRQVDHCRTPYRLWCGQDFSAADHHHPLCPYSSSSERNLGHILSQTPCSSHCYNLRQLWISIS